MHILSRNNFFLKNKFRIMCLVVFAGALVFSFVSLRAAAVFSAQTPLAQHSTGLSVPFVVNVGQYDSTVAFQAELMPGSLAVTANALIYAAPSSTGFTETPVHGSFAPQGLDRSPTKVSYFVGNDKSQWKSDLPTYTGVTLGSVFKGIRVDLQTKQNTVEKIFTIAPKALPTAIAFTVSNNATLSVTKNGGLAVQLGPQSEPIGFVFSKPLAYQIIQGKKKMIPVRYLLQNTRTYGFAVGSYDNTQPLVIDPELDTVVASTYIGGAGTESGLRGVIGGDGNIFVAGATASNNLPVSAGAYGSSLVGTNGVFVARFSDTAHLVALTYLGSPGQNTNVSDILLDSSGNPIVYGNTAGSFPTTADAFRTSVKGANDVYLAKFNPDLTQLLHSTVYGSSINDSALNFRRDNDGNIYIYMGTGNADDTPTTTSAYQGHYQGNGGSVTVLAKFDTNLTTLLAMTYLQGNNTTFGGSMTLDPSGHVWATGQAAGTNFPTSTSAFQGSKNLGSSYDAYITEFDAGLTTLLHGTYLGGSGDDIGNSLTFDNAGNVYISGTTLSSDFPNTTSTNGYQKTYHGGTDFFIAKLDSALTTLQAATYLGGNALEFLSSATRGQTIAVSAYGSNNEIFLYGNSQSTTTFPVTAGAYQTAPTGGSTATVISKLSGDLQNLVGSTLFIGSGSITNGGFIPLPTGVIYVFSHTQTVTGFPISHAYQSVNAGGFDTGITVFASTPVISSLSPASIEANSAFTLTILGSAFAPSSTVQIGDIAVATSSVVVDSSSQITAVIPRALVSNVGPTMVTVANGGVATSSNATLTISRPPVSQAPTPLISVKVDPSPLVTLSAPGSVDFTYTVTNAGTIALNNVTLTDDACSQMKYISGDIDKDGLLERDESWTYQCTATFTRSVVTYATAQGVGNGVGASDTEVTEIVVGALTAPSTIHIVKTSDLVLLPPNGGPVSYSYGVTNVGVAPLTDIVVSDDKCKDVTYMRGDTNADGKLQSGETWIYHCTMDLKQTTTNTAIATGYLNRVITSDIATVRVAVALAGSEPSGTGNDADHEIAAINARIGTITSLGFAIHDLVKLKDDGNPKTQEDTTVYYIGADGKRHVFTDSKSYFSWYCNFSKVRTISLVKLAQIPLGKNIVYRPGIQLVKFPSDPTVYVVQAFGVLRPIPNESVARMFAGSDWRHQIQDISEAFFRDYTFGTPLSPDEAARPSAFLSTHLYPSAEIDILGYYDPGTATTLICPKR